MPEQTPEAFDATDLPGADAHATEHHGGLGQTPSQTFGNPVPVVSSSVHERGG